MYLLHSHELMTILQEKTIAYKLGTWVLVTSVAEGVVRRKRRVSVFCKFFISFIVPQYVNYGGLAI